MSLIFQPTTLDKITFSIVETLNSHPDFLSESTSNSTRAVGDAVEEILGKSIPSIMDGLIQNYTDDFARRAMADLAFYDKQNNYYRVDVKTHREGTAFSMPNLTSVERLAKFYEDDANYFCIMMVKYHIDDQTIKVQECIFTPIEGINWDCLTIGALGWGQIQISNASRINLETRYSRKEWMLKLCDNLLQFYPKEIAKIGKRISYFEQVRQSWQNKS